MKVEFWTDGACTRNGREGANMGAGIVGICEGRRKEWGFSLGAGTNNQAEVLAIQLALRQLENRHQYDVVIYSDSQWAVLCLNGIWHPVLNLELLRETQLIMAECKSIHLAWLKGHAGHEENCRADQIASASARGEMVTLIDVDSQQYRIQQSGSSPGE